MDQSDSEGKSRIPLKNLYLLIVPLFLLLCSLYSARPVLALGLSAKTVFEEQEPVSIEYRNATPGNCLVFSLRKDGSELVKELRPNSCGSDFDHLLVDTSGLLKVGNAISNWSLGPLSQGSYTLEATETKISCSSNILNLVFGCVYEKYIEVIQKSENKLYFDVKSSQTNITPEPISSETPSTPTPIPTLTPKPTSGPLFLNEPCASLEDSSCMKPLKCLENSAVRGPRVDVAKFTCQKPRIPTPTVTSTPSLSCGSFKSSRDCTTYEDYHCKWIQETTNNDKEGSCIEDPDYIKNYSVPNDTPIPTSGAFGNVTGPSSTGVPFTPAPTSTSGPKVKSITMTCNGITSNFRDAGENWELEIDNLQPGTNPAHIVITYEYTDKATTSRDEYIFFEYSPSPTTSISQPTIAPQTPTPTKATTAPQATSAPQPTNTPQPTVSCGKPCIWSDVWTGTCYAGQCDDPKNCGFNWNCSAKQGCTNGLEEKTCPTAPKTCGQCIYSQKVNNITTCYTGVCPESHPNCGFVNNDCQWLPECSQQVACDITPSQQR